MNKKGFTKKHTCLNWIEYILATWKPENTIKVASIRTELVRHGQFYNDATISNNLKKAEELRLCFFESKNFSGENLYSLKPVKKV